MEQQNFSELLKGYPKFEIQTIKTDKNFNKTHVVFEGVPNRHKDNSKKMVLITGVDSGDTRFYEFDINDIDRFENVETVVSLNGKAFPVVKIWVKLGVLAFRYEPFVVVDGKDSFNLTIDNFK